MSHSIAAIDTPYKGHRFRSRLEARWAVFYDLIGERWNTPVVSLCRLFTEEAKEARSWRFV